jgi:hypothetical protein
LSTTIAASIGVHQLDQITLFYPNSVDLAEIASLRKTLSGWVEITLLEQGFEQIKKAVSEPTISECGETFLPGLLLMFHPGFKVSDNTTEIHERTGAIVSEGQKQSPPNVAEALARISQIQILDCQMPNPANDKTYQEPKRLLMILQQYWRLCRELVLDQTDAKIGLQPHPLLPLIVNAKRRIETCFGGLSSLHKASDVQNSAVTLIEILLSAEPDDLSVVPEWTFGEVAKVDTFLTEAQLSLGSASYDLTSAEQAFIKVFEHAAAAYRNRVKKTWNGMLSKLEAEVQKRKQAGEELVPGRPAIVHTSPQAATLKSEPPGPSVVLGQPGTHCLVLGVKKRALTDGQYAIVAALLEARAGGLGKDALEGVRSSGRRILKELRKDADWAKVILLPGQTNGRYRIRT